MIDSSEAFNRTTYMLQEEMKREKRWYVFAFAIHNQFLGCVFVYCHGPVDGFLKIKDLGQYPGGGAGYVEVEVEDLPPSEMRERLLLEEEVKAWFEDKAPELEWMN